MKRITQNFAILTFFLTISTSCIFMEPSIKGDGNVVTENRKADSFDEIKVSRGVNVYLTQSIESEVIVQSDKNLLTAIDTKVEGGILKISSNKRVRGATSFKVFVTNPLFSKISTSSGSNLYSKGEIKSDNLILSSSSGSNIKIEIETDVLTTKVSSGSNIKLSGKTEIFQGKVSSGSNLMGKELAANSCTAKASSGANLWITVKNNFDGHASSGGNIFYFGNPKTINTKESSGGNIIKK